MLKNYLMVFFVSIPFLSYHALLSPVQLLRLNGHHKSLLKHPSELKYSQYVILRCLCILYKSTVDGETEN